METGFHAGVGRNADWNNLYKKTHLCTAALSHLVMASSCVPGAANEPVCLGVLTMAPEAPGSRPVEEEDEAGVEDGVEEAEAGSSS